MGMPVDMIEEILVRLPVKSLLRFKCVCKHWCDVIESRRFVDRHYCHDSNRDRLVFRRLVNNIEGEEFEEAKEEFEEGNGEGVNLGYFVKCAYRMGPVNGVFCEVGSRGTIVLLNPATHKVKRLPSLPPLPRPRPLADLNFGFGLDPSTGDYKTVAFYGAEFACVHSSSSSSSSSSVRERECWRFIQALDPSLVSPLWCGAYWPQRCGGYCNGVYYWARRKILAFDTITETFREIQPPARSALVDMDLYFGGGSESRILFWSFTTSLALSSDIWTLEIGSGCWSKIFSTATMSIPMPFPAGCTWLAVCVWKNEVVCAGSTWIPVFGWKGEAMAEKSIHDPNLIAVDICTGKVKRLRLGPRDCCEAPLLTAFSYKACLVSFPPKPTDGNLPTNRLTETVNLGFF